MYNEEKIIETLSIIQDSCFTDLNNYERILVISNLLLLESVKYFPPEIEKEANNVVTNGKRINYEMLKFEDNLGLNLAMKAHLIVSDITKEAEGDINE